VTDGAIVTAYQSTPLAVIQQLDPIYVDVPQSTAEVLKLERRLKSGVMSSDSTNTSKVELYLEDGIEYPLKGTLQFRDISVDPTTASVILRMVFPNPGSVLLPNMYVRAKIEEGIKEHAILIPQQTVSRDTKGNPYLLLETADNKLEQRAIQLDRALGDKWLVTAGLAAGDRLIIEGIQNIRPGMAVRAVTFDANETNFPTAVATSKK
jgi:membrane fusion protein (multidrug efflux system)